MDGYEKASLKLQRIRLIIEAIGLMAAMVLIWLVWAQVRDQVKSTSLQIKAIEAQVKAIEAQIDATTKAQHETLNSSVYQDLRSKQLDLDKIFIDKPRIYRIMFGKQKVPKDKLPPEVISATHYYLDFFQLVYTQRTHLPALQDENGVDWIGWKNTMANAFKESPLLCDQLWDSKEMYGKDFVTYIETNQWCQAKQE